MKGFDQKTETPMIGGSVSAGFGNPMLAPKFRAKKNQNKTAANAHKIADQKNALGLGKKDTNIFAVFRLLQAELLRSVSPSLRIAYRDGVECKAGP